MLFAILSFGLARADHLSDELIVSAKLTGDQEVPAVITDAQGIGSITINSTWDSLFVNVSVNKLSGPVTGIHIHSGMPGENGPVETNLSSDVVRNRIIATITGDDLTPELIAGLLNGDHYLNVHTDENPNGEIRGQLTVESDYTFRSWMDAGQQTMEVESDALGLVHLNLSRTGESVQLRAVVDGLSGPIAAAHLHYGAMGQDGPVGVDLMSYIDGNSIVGDFQIVDYPELIENLYQGMVYLNVHTNDFPDGEIRGNLMYENQLAFDSWLNTDQEVMMPMGADGYGVATMTLSSTLDTIWYEVLTTDLTGEITGAHIHDGEVGVDGDVIVGLTPEVDGNMISGMVSGEEVTLELIQKMLRGGTYINIHTDMNPAGEIRGQVYRLAREGYTLALESNQEVPRKFAIAKGSGLITIDRDQSNAHVMIVVSDLNGPLTGAHFHGAPMGQNGDVIYHLTPWFEALETDDAAFGYWTSDDDMPFTPLQSLQFRNKEVYVNIHTDARPAGEVRGQALRGANQFMHQLEDNGELPMDPMFESGILFSAKLNGEQEVPAVSTDALGVGGFLLNETRDTMFVNVNLDGLSGPITGMHIHDGVAGTNGDVIFDLSDMLSGNQARGFITDFDLSGFIKSEYYVNVHTDLNPSGEIRGQIGFESDWSFIGELDGEQEVPAVTTDAFGKVVANLTKDESQLQIRVVTTGLSGAITGAHLHQAPEGMNGDVVLNLTEDININSIEVTVDPSEFLSDLKEGNIYINIHTELNPGGEIRAQLNLAEAFVFDAWLNGMQEVPSIDAPGTGMASLWMNDAWDELNYDIVVDQISGPIDAIHIHGAGLGENGDVLANLTPSIDGNRISGTITGDLLTEELVTMLINGQCYFNLHTSAFPSGEIRGQIYRLARQGYSYVLCGDQEVPAVDAMAYGGGILSIDRGYTTAHTMFTATNLSGGITGAHLHNAPAGENGPVLYGLTEILEENSGFVYQPIDNMGAMAILDGDVYLNLHTSDNPDGEIRGQIDSMMDCPEIMIVGIDEPTIDATFSAYPVPFGNQVNIELDKTTSAPLLIELVDITGKVVLQKPIAGTQSIITLDTSELQTGLYVIRLRSDEVFISRRVLKK
ncbi:CHRD domain-containing protein [Sanyastnella coralliicola]|uniref:CHRD domain-containing protein n=1 Tax=Sanyastnella coralliicola TaxID=3069118 RepID=UPI0027B8EAA2|nr:CHRD domain-containing protein [Longitalea sp. SCSIO 12813]